MISVPSSLLALAPEWSMETGLWGSLVLASVLVASFASWRGNTVLRTVALALALFVGGAFFPRVLAGYLLLGSGLVSLLFFLLLFLSGFWSRSWMMGCAAMMVLGLGGILLPGSPHNLAELGHRLASLRCHSPWWLLGLGLLPIVATLGWNRLASDDRRPWLTLALRLLGVTLLVLALADPFFAQAARSMTVLFVLDRSLSIPEELGEDPESPGVRRDLRALRIQNWINDCVAQRGAGREQDQAGLIVFGKQPRLELPPSDGPRFALRELPAADDGSATNIGAALKLALASFPEAAGRRIVLISDGNQNLGDAEEQARMARSLGVAIDILPLAAGKRQTNEVLVEAIDAPPQVETGARLPLRVLVRSHHPGTVVGRLILRQVTEKEGAVTLRLDRAGESGLEVEPIPNKPSGVRVRGVSPGSPGSRAGLQGGDEIIRVDDTMIGSPGVFREIMGKAVPDKLMRLTVVRDPVKVLAIRDPARLQKGLNSFSFERPLSEEQRSYTYEAEFQPVGIEDDKGRLIQKGLPGDRIQNNRAGTHVIARGRGRVLLLENVAGQHRELANRLVQTGQGRFQVVAEPVDLLDNYKTREQLAVFLSNFDCVILADIPAERISEEQQELLRSNTQDQGAGLVMIGGPDGFGAGGWQNTPVEKALPVDCDIRSLKVDAKGGLVLIMHASEMAKGNYWQKRIAKLAIDRLGPQDEVGVIHYDFACKWHIPMSEVGPNRGKMLGQIDLMTPGDMPDFDPALQMALDALADPAKKFASKHIIIISDGDPVQGNKALIPKIMGEKITIATVGVATHGAPEDRKLTEMASPIGNSNRRRYYKVTDPRQLPAIYIKESRLVSQAFVARTPFDAQVVLRGGPTAGLPDRLPLGGFVRTTPKANPLVERLIMTPVFSEQEFPILAAWNYGLGKSVAFTSDAGLPEFWSRRWLTGDGGRDGIFGKFWEQVIGWAQRPMESGRLLMNTEQRDGKIRVIVEARTPDGKPDTALKLRAGVTGPRTGAAGESSSGQLRFTQKNAGLYEAEVKAEEAGSYFITAQATRTRKVIDPATGKPREVEESVDSVRAGVNVPFSSEYSDLESNVALLERVREISGGRSYEDDPELLRESARLGEVFRPVEQIPFRSLPVHYWLMLLAGACLLTEVAIRRLSIDHQQWRTKLERIWMRLRGFPLPPPTPITTGRLTARTGPGKIWTPTPSPTITGTTSRSTGSPSFTAARPEPPGKQVQPTQGSGSTEAGGLEDLLEAKKRVWKERGGDAP